MSHQIETEGVELPLEQLGSDAWQLEPGGVNGLIQKTMRCGVSLSEYVGSKPLTGIKTAFNDAYFFDSVTRNSLVTADPKCADVIKPYVRGSDIGRWTLDSAGLWMITMKSSGDYAWPWAERGDHAEEVFRLTYPSLYAHMKQYEAALRKRTDQGRFWWELRSCAYWNRFAEHKLYYQLIQFHPCYAIDRDGMFGNNKTAFILSADRYLLAVLNSPLMWWYNWRYLPHMKDEALAPNPSFLDGVPIAKPNESIRAKTEAAAGRLVAITDNQQKTRSVILDWLRIEHEIDKPNMKLRSPLELGSDGFVTEVKRLRGKRNPLSAAALKSLRDEHARTIEPARTLAAEAEINARVSRLFHLTPDEITSLLREVEH